MLNEHRKFQLKTLDGKLEAEVNWSKEKKVKDCNVIKFTLDDKEFIMKRSELMSLMLLVGSADDQEKLMPMKLSRIKKYETMLTFEFPASRNYKKGEKVLIKAPHIFTIPETEEVIAGNIKK